jgi:D-inositol-3-phosphate glycosyltransferase
MRILFVLENYYPNIGGAEVLFKNLCEGLAGKGNNVTVITTLLPGTQQKEVLNGVNIVRVRTPAKASRYWFTFMAIPLSIKLAGRSEIVHTTTYNGAFPAWLAARLRGKKCLITVLEIIGKHWKEMAGMGTIKASLHEFLERVIIALPFDLYCAISRYTAECIKLCGVKSEMISVVYPGIDYQLFDPEKADGRSIRNKLGIHEEYVYMYYGRPGISKGVEYLVEAVPLISEKLKYSKLLMLLAREPVEGYRNILDIICRLQLKEKVMIVDPVPRDQLPSYIAAADCIIVPSLSEGFGFSAAEACAMEKPVVLSNVASLPEVASGKYALIEPGSPQAIALGVEAVYNNKTKLGEKKLFEWSYCVDAYEKIYSRLSRVIKETASEFQE